MRNITVLCGLAIIAPAAVLGLSFASNATADKTTTEPRQDSQSPVEAHETPASSGDDESDSVLDEITNIRRRLDIDLYKGTSLNGHGASGSESGKNGFEEALKRIASKLPAAQVNERGQSKDYDELRLPNRDISCARDAGFVAAMREASRQLDSRANDFENERQFEYADRLRDVADQLRKEARLAECGETDSLNKTTVNDMPFRYSPRFRHSRRRRLTFLPMVRPFN